MCHSRALHTLLPSFPPFFSPAFLRLHGLCSGHLDLQEVLLDMLRGEDAVALSSHVYSEWRMRQAIKSFFRKLKVFFEAQGQTQTYNKVVKELNSEGPNWRFFAIYPRYVEKYFHL